MRARPIVAIAAVAVLAGVVPASATAESGSAADARLASTPGVALAPTTAVPPLRISGAVTSKMTLTMAQISKMPSVTETVTFLSGSGSETDTFEGPLLINVLNAAGPTFDPTVKNDQLRFAITATGSDDYQAVVAWGEIDPNFGNKEMLVAYKENGVRLSEPRLVVPGDIHGGRYVSDLVGLRLTDLGG